MSQEDDEDENTGGEAVLELHDATEEVTVKHNDLYQQIFSDPF